MKTRYNPFKPNHPVFRGMFAGRDHEIARISNALFQTKNGNPTHILIEGERGIGKTSMLLVSRNLAKGDVILQGHNYNFLTVQLSIMPNHTIGSFAQKLHTALDRELKKESKGAEILKDTWGFIQRLNIAGSQIKKTSSNNDIGDQLMYSIADTVKMLRSDSIVKEIGIKNKKDGLVICIDEADKITSEFQMGAYLKNLSEYLVSESANYVLFIVAGLPQTRDLLHQSHESSLRLFEELMLSPLTNGETERVITQGLGVYNEKVEGNSLSIAKKALENIHSFSEGYPHFIQQIGYSMIEICNGIRITAKNVEDGFLNDGGALDQIGDRYYKDLFYNKINVESYRNILRIMSENWNGWVKKSYIQKEFKGKDSILTNGIKALRDRNIILSRKGFRGQYRLQWLSFAFWIKYYAMEDK